MLFACCLVDGSVVVRLSWLLQFDCCLSAVSWLCVVCEMCVDVCVMCSRVALYVCVCVVLGVCVCCPWVVPVCCVCVVVVWCVWLRVDWLVCLIV